MKDLGLAINRSVKGGTSRGFVSRSRAVPMRWSCLTLTLTLALILTGSECRAKVRSSGPAEDLFRLVPTDSGLTLAVEDLRGHSKQIRESALFQGLNQLEAIRSWRTSREGLGIEKTWNEIQASFGLTLEAIRDDLLGDAVILALQPGPPTQPDLAQGLLLVRPRDRELVARILKSLNEIQTRSGELDRVESRSRGNTTYMVRQFKAGQRPPEFYIQFDDGPFAWSNSEAMIHGVIDRKSANGQGLGNDPNFRKVRGGLPERALVSLFVNPRLLERLMTENSTPAKAATDRLPALFARYLGAVSQLGFAVQWQDGFVFHSHEVLDPGKLEPWLKRWLTQPSAAPGSIPPIPPTAVAVVAANIDFAAVAEATRALIPEADRPSVANLTLVAKGMLLGHEPMTWLIPRLHHQVFVYLDVEPEPNGKPTFPWVAIVGWSNQPGGDEPAGPIDNALRTMFALVAVDPKYRDSHLKVETRPHGEARLTALIKDGGRTLMAYRSDPDRLTLGNSIEAVTRSATMPGPTASPLDEIRAKYVAGAETFAVVDTQRLTREVKRIQEPLARRLAAKSHRTYEETDHDLGQLIALASLFRAFTFATFTTRDATEIHRTIGLYAR